MSQHKNVALLLTGNELMSGDTVDSNSSHCARFGRATNSRQQKDHGG